MAGRTRSPSRASTDRSERGGTRDPLSLAVGARIRELRLARDFSQEELAARAGIPPEQVARYESARQSATVRTIAKLAAGLSVAPADLFTATPPGEPAAVVPAELRDVALAVARRGPVAIARAKLAIFAALADPQDVVEVRGADIE